MNQGPTLEQLNDGEAQFMEVVALVEHLRSATSVYISGSADPRQAMSMLITAGVVFAGSQLGMLLTMGDANQRQKKAFERSIVRNFRTGIQVGERKAARLLKESTEGSA